MVCMHMQFHIGVTYLYQLAVVFASLWPPCAFSSGLPVESREECLNSFLRSKLLLQMRQPGSDFADRRKPQLLLVRILQYKPQTLTTNKP